MASPLNTSELLLVTKTYVYTGSMVEILPAVPGMRYDLCWIEINFSLNTSDFCSVINNDSGLGISLYVDRSEFWTSGIEPLHGEVNHNWAIYTSGTCKVYACFRAVHIGR